MNSRPPFPVKNLQRTAEVTPKSVALSIPTESTKASDDNSPLEITSRVEYLIQSAIELNPQEQLLFIKQLFKKLAPKQLQTALELGQQTLAHQQPQKSKATSIQRETVLTLKKDYTYQDRGLSEPTQYYVYLRRRKPKLDRYIGTLFYVPTGCVLNYVSDSVGHLVFEPPHNTFQLTDAKDPSVTKVVRLVRLEPPPADYTFTKQQQDTPAIRLLVEFLDPTTLKAIAKQSLPFPSCMHEGGVLDRYRWDVTVILLQLENQSIPN